jgi:hypothetical protein
MSKMTRKAIVSDQEKHRTQEDKREETQEGRGEKGARPISCPATEELCGIIPQFPQIAEHNAVNKHPIPPIPHRALSSQTVNVVKFF